MTGGRSVLPNLGPLVRVRSVKAAWHPVGSEHTVHKTEAISLIALGCAEGVGEHSRRDSRAEDNRGTDPTTDRGEHSRRDMRAEDKNGTARKPR